MYAYISAIKKSINKDTVVVDLGAGTGIFSLIACKFGAKRVYAIEPNPAINLGIKASKKSGFAEKIQFINKYSAEVELKEKADLIIFDLRGKLPLHKNNIEIIIDARKRFLKKSGVFVPGSDQIWASVVESPRKYNDIIGAWDNNRYKFDLSDGKIPCLNTIHPMNKIKAKFLTERRIWLDIDYYRVNKTSFKNKLILKTIASGTAHGIYIWFNCNLVPGVKLINSPDVKGSKVYGRVFFPFLEPVVIKKGDKIELDISAKLDTNNYLWTWKTKIYKKFGKKPIKEFKQSTFFNNISSLENYFKKSPSYKTSLNERASIDFDILKMFNKNYSVERIAKIILEKFPKKFRNIDESVQFVGLMSLKYSN